MSIEHIRGIASIPAWDQAHAAGLHDLRTCEAFILVTLDPKTSQLRFRACGKDLSADAMGYMLTATYEQAAASALELAAGE